ncbi:PVC-type heme-binding CxxCH protein [Aurantibacter sp.]|uniref:PVC-type heme-binding CxxCH protein n=1 Tax=Aurantibacter sp. TaxID=2807103 RepID=UPI0032636825
MNSILKGIFGVLLIIPLLIGCNTKKEKSFFVDDQPRRIELLFLGHELEHHNSRKYFPILAAALTKEGINITYTENTNDLNSDNLNLYDGLIIYANHEEILPNQESALLDYISNGHALIPIHSASFCFKNSSKYIDLVGAQFKEHSEGIFKTTIVKKDHPTMLGLEEFSTWDETYVHDKIADDIEILMERVEGEHHEPWTWVKSVGKGKVFYTAYGHDERTWNQTGFQQLIKQGILWSVDAIANKNWEAYSKDIPTLAYEERDNIPNYEKRDSRLKYQLPLTPEASAKLIQVPVEFNLELFASEPDIINPIAMNWDEKGRLWVIETVDYPNTVRDKNGIGDDKVKILEDTDNDGKADKVTIFAENLNIPTSFAFYDGGIIVSQAPHFLFLKDTDGDDKADIREIAIDGWGTYDTHAGPSNLQYGIDNNLYGVVGYSGFEGTIYGEELDFNQNMYRFDPKNKYFEVLTNTSNNTWGLGITEDNSLFASTANNTHSVYLGIPNKIMKDVEGIPAQGSLKIDGHYAMQPLTPNIRQVDVFGGFTAAAGHHFYTARNYPSIYWNKFAFVCEPTGGLVHIAKIEREGANYIEKDGGNLFASSDEWVSPVEAKVGPDGNVWVADWYNFIIQHNPTPREDNAGYDATNGKGNAYENPLRDKSRGRIWRIVPKNDIAKTAQSLDKEDSDDLIKALSNNNMFWRLTAQRLLVDNENNEVLSDLYKLANNKKVDAMGMNTSALHALWTINGLADLSSNKDALNTIVDALNHPSYAVRKAALQIIPKNETSDKLILDSNLLADKNELVRLATLLYFAERPASDAIGSKLFNISEEESIIADDWLSKATYAAASKHSKGFIDAFTTSNPDFKVNEETVKKRQEIDFDDSKWKTMQIPQYIEDAGLEMDGVIWFRKEFNFSSYEKTHISLGPIDDSDIVYINGEKIGATEKDYERNRYYDVPTKLLLKNKNVIAIRVEDTGGGGGIYGEPEQLYIRSGNKTTKLSGEWKYEIETNYSQASKNAFSETSIAQVFTKNYANSSVKDNTNDIGSDRNSTVINMKTIKNEMKFNLSEIVVEAGESIELVLENVDFMQHNLIIIKPGTIEKVGAAADKLAQEPKGADLNYVPNMNEVLFATDLINPQETVTLKFTAPNEPGMYPFVCTFPGHWRFMKGIMKVVSK